MREAQPEMRAVCMRCVASKRPGSLSSMMWTRNQGKRDRVGRDDAGVEIAGYGCASSQEVLMPRQRVAVVE